VKEQILYNKGGNNMWISKKKWELINIRLEKLERHTEMSVKVDNDSEIGTYMTYDSPYYKGYIKIDINDVINAILTYLNCKVKIDSIPAFKRIEIIKQEENIKE